MLDGRAPFVTEAKGAEAAAADEVTLMDREGATQAELLKTILEILGSPSKVHVLLGEDECPEQFLEDIISGYFDFFIFRSRCTYDEVHTAKNDRKYVHF